MTVHNNSLIQQILNISGVKKSDLKSLRARLEGMSSADLQRELSRLISGGDKTGSVGDTFVRTTASEGVYGEESHIDTTASQGVSGDESPAGTSGLVKSDRIVSDRVFSNIDDLEKALAASGGIAKSALGNKNQGQLFDFLKGDNNDGIWNNNDSRNLLMFIKAYTNAADDGVLTELELASISKNFEEKFGMVNVDFKGFLDSLMNPPSEKESFTNVTINDRIRTITNLDNGGQIVTIRDPNGNVLKRGYQIIRGEQDGALPGEVTYSAGLWSGGIVTNSKGEMVVPEARVGYSEKYQRQLEGFVLNHFRNVNTDITNLYEMARPGANFYTFIGDMVTSGALAAYDTATGYSNPNASQIYHTGLDNIIKSESASDDLSAITKSSETLISATGSDIPTVQRSAQDFANIYKKHFGRDFDYRQAERLMDLSKRLGEATAIKEQISQFDDVIDLASKKFGYGSEMHILTEADVEELKQYGFNINTNPTEADKLDNLGDKLIYDPGSNGLDKYDNRKIKYLLTLCRTLGPNSPVVQDIKDNSAKLITMEDSDWAKLFGGIKNNLNTVLNNCLGSKNIDELKKEYTEAYSELYGEEPNMDRLETLLMTGSTVGSLVEMAVVMTLTHQFGSMLQNGLTIARDAAELESFAANMTGRVATAEAEEGMDALAKMLKGIYDRYGQEACAQYVRLLGNLSFPTFDVASKLLTAGSADEREMVLDHAETTYAFALLGGYFASPLAQEIKAVMPNKVLGTVAELGTEISTFATFESIINNSDLIDALGPNAQGMLQCRILSFLVGSRNNTMMQSKIREALKGIKQRTVSENGHIYYELVREGKTLFKSQNPEDISTQILSIAAGETFKIRLGKKIEMPQELSDEVEVRPRPQAGTDVNAVNAKNAANAVFKQWVSDGIGNVGGAVPLASAVNGSIETSRLVFGDKLPEYFNEFYNGLQKHLTEIGQKRSEDIAELSIQNCDNKQAIADGIIKILAKEFGMTGLESPVVFSDISTDGFADFANGRIVISNKINNAADLTSILTHEFGHMLQLRDVLGQYGEQGIRDMISENKSIPADSKDLMIQQMLDNPYIKRLVASSAHQLTRPGDPNYYLIAEYRNNMSNSGNLNNLIERASYTMQRGIDAVIKDLEGLIVGEDVTNVGPNSASRFGAPGMLDNSGNAVVDYRLPDDAWRTAQEAYENSLPNNGRIRIDPKLLDKNGSYINKFDEKPLVSDYKKLTSHDVKISAGGVRTGFRPLTTGSNVLHEYIAPKNKMGSLNFGYNSYADVTILTYDIQSDVGSRPIALGISIKGKISETDIAKLTDYLYTNTVGINNKKLAPLKDDKLRDKYGKDLKEKVIYFLNNLLEPGNNNIPIPSDPTPASSTDANRPSTHPQTPPSAPQPPVPPVTKTVASSSSTNTTRPGTTHKFDLHDIEVADPDSQFMYIDVKLQPRERRIIYKFGRTYLLEGTKRGAYRGFSFPGEIPDDVCKQFIGQMLPYTSIEAIDTMNQLMSDAGNARTVLGTGTPASSAGATRPGTPPQKATIIMDSSSQSTGTANGTGTPASSAQSEPPQPPQPPVQKTVASSTHHNLLHRKDPYSEIYKEYGTKGYKYEDIETALKLVKMIKDDLYAKQKYVLYGNKYISDFIKESGLTINLKLLGDLLNNKIIKGEIDALVWVNNLLHSPN